MGNDRTLHMWTLESVALPTCNQHGLDNSSCQPMDQSTLMTQPYLSPLAAGDYSQVDTIRLFVDQLIFGTLKYPTTGQVGHLSS